MWTRPIERTAKAPAETPRVPVERPAPSHLAVQRKPAGGDGAQDKAASPAPAAGEKSPIVDDGATPAPGEMTRGEFMGALRPMVTAACNEELAAVGQSAEGCPYIEYWLSFYEGRSASDIARAVQQYASPPAGANAMVLLAAVVARARVAVQRWVGGGAGAEGADNGTSPGGASAPVQAKSEGAARTHDPVAVKSRLGAGQSIDPGVRGPLEGAFGRSFADVRIHTTADAEGLSRSMSARAFTVGRDIGFGAGEYRPETIEGKALLAHELAHTLQQASGTAPRERGSTPESAALEHEADRAAEAAVNPLEEASRFAPSARGGLRLSRCKSCNDSEKKGVAMPGSTFSQVKEAIAKAPDEAAKKTALEQGVAASRVWAHQLFGLTAAQDPLKSIRDRMMDETKITDTGNALDMNPFIGVSQDRVEAAYRAWYEGGGKGKEPWILLAVWAKEGAEKADFGDISAKSAADAKAIWRSQYFWQNLGTDYYMAHTSTASGDNMADFDPARSQAAFKKGVDKQVKAGRLPRDISAEIDNELNATAKGKPDASGKQSFTITPTPRFYVLSLLLIDAYYRENEAAVAADPQLAGPDGTVEPAMVYARWNLGQTRFDKLVKSAEGHRKEPEYQSDAGAGSDAGAKKSPSISEWSFHRPIKSGEWDQPRRNAVRFAYKAEVFRYAYEGGF